MKTVAKKAYEHFKKRHTGMSIPGFEKVLENEQVKEAFSIEIVSCKKAFDLLNKLPYRTHNVFEYVANSIQIEKHLSPPPMPTEGRSEAE